MDGGDREKPKAPLEPGSEGADASPAEESSAQGKEPSAKKEASPPQKEKPPVEKQAPAQEGEKPPAGKDAAPSEEGASEAAAAEGKPKPPRPAKAAAKPGAAVKKKRPLKKKGPSYKDLEDDPLAEALREHFGDALQVAHSFLKQKIYTVALDQLYDIMLFLRDRPEWSYDYLIDVTALDGLDDEKRFCLVYQLYSFSRLDLIRVKSRLGKDEVAPSVTAIWKTADWLEREAYDMFGIEFSGHPDLRRILLPEDWHGFPLRKDYDIKLQDQAWIKKHLRIRKVPS